MAVNPKLVTFGLPLDPTALAVLAARLEINIPPEGFDPRTATDAELATYCLPPRPDVTQTPVAYELWRDAMSPPLIFLKPPPRLADMFTTVKPRVSHMKASNTAQAQEASQNWSGAYVRPRDFSKIMLVQGNWTVPMPTVPAGVSDGTYASSIWVGVDGHDPASRSLPQVGTGQYVNVTGGTPQNDLFAWWQWWDRFDPAAVQVVINGFVVNAGDEIHGHVHVLHPTLVSFFLKNKSSGLALPFRYKAPPPATVLTGPNARPVLVEGRTAEWIVERPVDPTTMHYFPLVNYGFTSFIRCNAAAGTQALKHDQQLQRARLIGMNVWDQPAHPGIRISSPTRNGSDSVKVHFGT